MGSHPFAKEKVKMLFSFLLCYLNRKIIAVTVDIAFHIFAVAFDD